MERIIILTEENKEYLKTINFCINDPIFGIDWDDDVINNILQTISDNQIVGLPSIPNYLDITSIRWHFSCHYLYYISLYFFDTIIIISMIIFISYFIIAVIIIIQILSYSSEHSKRVFIYF